MKYVLGIDIGGTNTIAGVVSENGEILVEFKFKTGQYDNATLLIQDIFNAYQDFNATKTYELSGVGIGAPNGNTYTGLIEYAPNLNWETHVPIAKITEEIFHLPVKITNDANAAAIGEKKFGCAQNMTDFVVLTLGTGLGSGIFVNGELLLGKNGFAGEFGHIKCSYVHRVCNCGMKGCLETVVSARGIKQTYEELYTKKHGINPTNLSVIDIHNLAQKNDPIAIETYQLTCKALAQGIASLIMILDTEAVILFGGIAHAHPIMIPIILNELNDMVLPVFKSKVKILPSALMDKNAAVLGSAAMFF
ncbi:MAG: ROK family protein [Bacteroidales bacterium]|nr:ROK family protein [Bacteroidales bacterium]